MSPHLMLAQAIAASLAPVRTGASAKDAPTLEQAFETLQATHPDESEIAAYRGAVVAAADEIGRQDEDAWARLLLVITFHFGAELLEAVDGRH
ncbi:hypothetical protein [Rhodoplanes elegans]|uniref:hypothetical protein n=1 Tax=Rhodoplanes elegans TaxID=29408 RepID=UPI0011B949B8|nr:hypothetical protein [Rhodoplanes elegans]